MTAILDSSLLLQIKLLVLIFLLNFFVLVLCFFLDWFLSKKIKTKNQKDITKGIEKKGMHLKHDFYVVVNKQCSTEIALTGNQLSLYKLTNVHLLFICFKLVLSF